jgi:hypothetical protein
MAINVYSIFAGIGANDRRKDHRNIVEYLFVPGQIFPMVQYFGRELTAGNKMPR